MGETLTIRAAKPSDLAAVDALMRRSFLRLLKEDYPPSVWVTALPILARANPALLASGTYFVAEAHDGTVVGAGGWTLSRPLGRRPGRLLGEVRQLATDPAWVRRGVGRGLMLRAFEQARGRGVRVMECKSTRTAVPFYATMGFRALGEANVALRPGIMFQIMRMVRLL